MGLGFLYPEFEVVRNAAAVSAAGFVKGSAPTRYMPIRRSGGW